MKTVISDLFLKPDDNIYKALAIINNQKIQIAFVVAKDLKLIGTITDGDVRRGFLKGYRLDSEVIKITNKNFHSIKYGEKSSKAKELMFSYKINQIPILNDKGVVIDVITKEKLTDEKDELDNCVVIMAGGLGKRLLPHTSGCPKPMLQIGGKPILEIILLECIANGLKEFYISVNYLKEKIIDYFGDGSKWGVKINYLIEPKKLGTAGSLKLLPQNLTRPFLVLNGDVLTRLNFKNLLKFHENYKNVATICVKKHEITVPFGVIDCEGTELKAIEEKPSYEFLINAGVYVIDPSLLALIPENTYVDMPTFLQDSKNFNNKISVCPIFEYWIDIGRPETLEEANISWENNKL